MNRSIMVRPLTPDEIKEFRKSELGQKAGSLKAISIVGLSDSSELKYLKVESKVRWVDLGGGQGIYDGPPPTPATPGKTATVVWSIDGAYRILLREAEKLDIPVFYTPSYPQYYFPLYFESVYTDAFLAGFSFADRKLNEWYHNRFFLTRWFGSVEIDPNSQESKLIHEEVRRLLSQVLPAR